MFKIQVWLRKLAVIWASIAFPVSSLALSPFGIPKYCDFLRGHVFSLICAIAHVLSSARGFCPSDYLPRAYLILNTHSSITTPRRFLCPHGSSEIRSPYASSVILSLWLFQSDYHTRLCNNSHLYPCPHLVSELLESRECVSFSAVTPASSPE